MSTSSKMQSSLLKRNSGNKPQTEKTQSWIHSPKILKSGHVAYTVKFLGKIEASQPKGIEVVKDSIKKLKFINELKLSEGNKVPKVELTISVDGVSIQDSKTKEISYKYPLHQISYCADDKTDNKLFCFIAKEPDSDKHNSFVFASDKLAEEITLTIGQAFDMAYKRFLETSGRELTTKQKIIILKKKVQDLEAENKKLYEQLCSLEKHKEQTSNAKKPVNRVDTKKSTSKNKQDLVPLQPPPPNQRHAAKVISQQNLLEFIEQPQTHKYVEFLDDIKDLENRYNASLSQTVAFYGIQNSANALSLSNGDKDPFGMPKFAQYSPLVQQKVGSNEDDKRLREMRDGFQRGLLSENGDLSTVYSNGFSN